MYAIQMHHAPTPSEVGRFRLITDCKKFYENFENFSEMFPRLTIYVKDLSVNVTPDSVVMVWLVMMLTNVWLIHVMKQLNVKIH